MLVLSAKGEDLDRIIGLEVGADDYLAKPFNPRELVARMRAVLRRRDRPAVAAPVDSDDPTPDAERYGFDGWRLEVARRALFDPMGAEVPLSGGEFALLVEFVRRPQRALTRDQLLEWTRGPAPDAFDRAIDVQLSRLRKKLGDDPRQPRLIKTLRGDGYLFAAAVQRLDGGGSGAR